MPQDISARVTRNRDLGHGNFLIEFELPDVLIRGMEPAQFFMIAIPGADVLLRRPFSVCGLPGTFEDAGPGTVQVLYRVVGKGTALLSAVRPGARLNVLGPLGNGFRLPDDPKATPVLVAGGIGAAPFPALAARLAEAGRLPRMVYGARTARELPLLDWFRDRCQEVSVTTEDGSLGHRGLVTEPLQAMLDGEGGDKLHLYVCGPHPMLRAVARMAMERGVRCDLSLEAKMACGFGVCLGCVIRTRPEFGDTSPGYERVCVEGPVMPAERVAW